MSWPIRAWVYRVARFRLRMRPCSNTGCLTVRRKKGFRHPLGRPEFETCVRGTDKREWCPRNGLFGTWFRAAAKGDPPIIRLVSRTGKDTLQLPKSLVVFQWRSDVSVGHSKRQVRSK